jgi:hypothetical protein
MSAPCFNELLVCIFLFCIVTIHATPFSFMQLIFVLLLICLFPLKNNQLNSREKMMINGGDTRS